MTTAQPNPLAQQAGSADPIPVIIDCDTGVDDALALLFAVRHPGLDLRAVTCVAGNTDVDQVVRNTLTVLDRAGAPDLPVARGAERPLIEPARPASHVHGRDGMGDLGLPAPTSRTAVDVDAVTLLRREILGSPRPVTLIPRRSAVTRLAMDVRIPFFAWARTRARREGSTMRPGRTGGMWSKERRAHWSDAPQRSHIVDLADRSVNSGNCKGRSRVITNPPHKEGCVPGARAFTFPANWTELGLS